MMNKQSQPMNQPPQILNRDYGVWPPPPVPVPPPPEDPLAFHNLPPRPLFPAPAPVPMPGRSNWKPQMGFNKRKDNRRIDKGLAIGGGPSGGASAGGGGGGGYKPPGLHELQSQNRLKARRFYTKKKQHNNRFAPFAPRNTTSFLIRAKRSGGIASLVSPCPVTPAVLSTPIFSPSREVLGDMAKEQWGVDGYGSMNGLIRLRSPGHEMIRDDEEDEDGGSSESDLEEREEVERRLNHDLSRFEMIYPNWADEQGNHDHVDGDVDDDDQDAHVARLEEENLTLKERLFLMERELVDLRTRLQCLETDKRRSKKEESCCKDNTDEMLKNEGFGVQGETDTHEEERLENEGVGIQGETNTQEEQRLEKVGVGIQGETTHDEIMEDECDENREENNGEALVSNNEVAEAKGKNNGEALENGSEGNVCSERSSGVLLE